MNSIRQTLTIVFEDDNWKIDSFSNKDEDLNLQESELEGFLETHSGPIMNIEYAGTKQINGVEEEIYQFNDTTSTINIFVFIFSVSNYEATSKSGQKFQFNIF